MPAQIMADQLQPGDPAFRALVERADLARRHLQLVEALQQRERFVVGELQVRLTQARGVPGGPAAAPGAAAVRFGVMRKTCMAGGRFWSSSAMAAWISGYSIDVVIVEHQRETRGSSRTFRPRATARPSAPRAGRDH